ncbi:MAG: hypothetical protein ACHQ51_09920 [Elusimicrobiota bacterium]
MTPLAPLLAAFLASSVHAQGPDAKKLSSYSFDASRPATSRIAKMPEWLLNRWQKMDGTRNYAAYLPKDKERREFEAAVNGLPPRLRKILDERLIAFYFVSNLKGNGITEWVLDASSRTYVYMVLNPAGFKMTLSQLLTERERSPFRGAADISVEAGAGSGILYTVTHESAHAFDYVRGLTPYVEPGIDALRGRAGPHHWDVWREYGVSLDEDSYPARHNLTFYGFGGGPKLDATDAPAVCAQWARSPFSSLYGSRNWADDVAELFVVRHLVRDLGLPYRVRCAGTIREPLSDPRVRERAERALEPIYEPEEPK